MFMERANTRHFAVQAICNEISCLQNIFIHIQVYKDISCVCMQINVCLCETVCCINSKHTKFLLVSNHEIFML
jgi:hypothetical protein